MASIVGRAREVAARLGRAVPGSFPEAISVRVDGEERLQLVFYSGRPIVYATYRARGVAARDTRKSKRHTAVDDLMPRWLGELETAGLSVEAIVAGIEHAAALRQRTPERLGAGEVAELVSHMLGPDSPLAERKVFTRADVLVALAPRLFGRDPAELSRAADAVVASAEAIPLLGVAAARERAYAPACVLAREAAIAAGVAALAARADAPAVAFPNVDWAIADKERALGRALTLGQADAAIAITTSGRAAEVVVGVAGSGKTTCLDVVRQAFESAGYRVLGTSTSGKPPAPSAAKPASASRARWRRCCGASTMAACASTSAPW